MKCLLATTVLLCLVLVLPEAEGHGYMFVPPGRSTAWRYDQWAGYFLVNYNDNQNYCGGKGIQFGVNGGKCGICGDDFRQKRPRDNERGGKYSSGHAVALYGRGQTIEVAVNLTANHWGAFYFDLCPENDATKWETEDCFIRLLDADTKLPYYILPSGKSKTFIVKLQLPQHVTCKACVLRWKYTTGNSWGCGANEYCAGPCAVGCGNQEHFFSCADVIITETGTEGLPTMTSVRPPATTRPSATTTPRPTPRPTTPRVTPRPNTTPTPTTEVKICNSFCKKYCKPGFSMFCLESMCGSCDFYRNFTNRAFDTSVNQ